MFTIQALAVLCIATATLAAEDLDFAFSAPASDGGSYYFRVDSQTPESASTYCVNKGMFLLEIPNLAANNELQQVIINKALTEHTFWTSGNRRANGKDWEWPRDGKRIEYANWAAGRPSAPGSNTDCLTVKIENGKLSWYDIDCKTQHAYICQTPA